MYALPLGRPPHTPAYQFCPCDEFTAHVVRILDGDTIEVLHNRHPERIRLSGIDCPEKGQAFGKQAKHATSELVFGQDVKIETHGKDKYGRTLADVRLLNRTHVNHMLVGDGWCWWYRKYAPGDTELEKVEKDAREAKKGLWVDPVPVPPWVYRKAKSGQSLDRSDLMPLETEIEGNTASRGPPLPGVVESAPALSSSPYPVIGNRRSYIYHRPDCPNYSQVTPHNRVEFNSPAEAEAAGYRMAGNCP